MGLTFPGCHFRVVHELNFASFPWHMTYDRDSVTPWNDLRGFEESGEREEIPDKAKGLWWVKVMKVGFWGEWSWHLNLILHVFPIYTVSVSIHVLISLVTLFSLLEMIFSQLPDELLLFLQKPYPSCRLPWAPGTTLLQVDSITVLPSPAPLSSTSSIGEESPLYLVSVEVCLEVYTKNRCLWGGHIIKERDLKTKSHSHVIRAVQTYNEMMWEECLPQKEIRKWHEEGDIWGRPWNQIKIRRLPEGNLWNQS